MEHMDLLLAHMADLADRANKAGCAASRFLTPAEAHCVAVHFKDTRAALSFDGGFENAERVRAVFLQAGWGECARPDLFAALQLQFRPQDVIGHRDILGAFMALGIERDTIGDIVMAERNATLVCLPELGSYIIENFTKAGRTGISVAEIRLEDLPVKQEELRIKTDTVASLRLDAVLCAAFGLSRAKAAELIAAGRVNLDHMLCLQPAKELGAGALVSARGLGRAKLLDIGAVSKKGRIFVRIGLYSKS